MLMESTFYDTRSLKPLNLFISLTPLLETFIIYPKRTFMMGKVQDSDLLWNNLRHCVKIVSYKNIKKALNPNMDQ